MCPGRQGIECLLRDQNLICILLLITFIYYVYRTVINRPCYQEVWLIHEGLAVTFVFKRIFASAHSRFIEPMHRNKPNITYFAHSRWPGAMSWKITNCYYYQWYLYLHDIMVCIITEIDSNDIIKCYVWLLKFDNVLLYTSRQVISINE